MGVGGKRMFVFILMMIVVSNYGLGGGGRLTSLKIVTFRI